MKTKIRLLTIVIFSLGLPAAFGSQYDQLKEPVIKNLESYSSYAAPQKVYLHLDKSEYTVGETIWFKAYLFDGITHLPYVDTSNIYVELIHSDGMTRDMRILLSEDGFARGEISLGEGLPDGNYVIRAYSGWMENFDDEFFFTRPLYINNPEWENAIRRWDVLRNRRFNRQLRRMRGEQDQASFAARVIDFITTPFTSYDYQVAFFPEGGQLIAGVTNRVAMKVIDPLGQGQNAEGEVLDQRGQVVASLETDSGGIAVFDIEPESGNTYTARLSINNERASGYELPEPRNDGYTLRVNSEQDHLKITVMTPGSRVEPEGSRLFLIGHTRGTPRFSEVVQLVNGMKEIVVDKTTLPSGITHFTLFTADHVPVAERLVFVRGDDELTFSPWVETSGVEPGFLGVEVIVRDKTGSRVEGNFSLSAVTGKSADAPERRSDLLTYILLSSELQGLTPDIHDLYFDGDDNNGQAIDNLLLTHGWRRFDWEEALASDFPEIEKSEHRGLAIRGTVKDPAKNESLTNYPVHLEVRSGHDDIFETTTERNGRFNFPGLYYEGQIEIALSSRRLPGNYPPEISLDITEARGYDYDIGYYTRERRVTSRGDDWSRRNRPPRGRVSGSTREETTEQLYGVPDQTIYIDYETSTERNLYEVLRNRATGLSFEGGTIMIRGPSSLVLSNEPRFMLDGVFIDANTFLNNYPRDIERIEIFRGASAAIFGVRGGTGVILAYSRRPGYSGFEDSMELVMLGYHTPSEFYLDNFSVENLSEVERRGGKTLQWEPVLITGNDGVFSTVVPVVEGTDRILITIEGTGFEGGLGFGEFIIEIDN